MSDITFRDEVDVVWPPPEQPTKPDGRDRWAGVARMGGVGDNLIAASVCAGLKRKGFKVEMLSQTPHSAVFEHNPYIDKLTVKGKDFVITDMLQWQRWFADRAKEYDLFANLSHSCETLTALFTIQTQFWWPEKARRKFCGRNYLEVVHDICDVPYEFGPLYFSTEEEKEAIKQTKATIGEKVIAWCLSGTRIDKVYPYATMAIARIIKELDIPVVMLGAPHDKHYEYAKQILAHVAIQNGTDRGLHLALSPDGANPSWPVRRVLNLAQACDLVVGPDTGPMWAVAFEPIPKVLMLSHASQENITKHWISTTTLHADPARVPCWPCHRLHDTIDTCVPNKENNGSACIADVSVENLLQAIKGELDNHQIY